jgi:hypothetical protein
LWPDFRFVPGLRKMILADRRFFKKQQLPLIGLGEVLLCSYSRFPSEDTLLRSHPSEVGLKIERRSSGVTSHSWQD